MKKIFRNSILIMLVLFLILSFFAPIFADQYPPFSDKQFYFTNCQGKWYQQNKERCEAFRTYLKDEVKEQESSLAELKNSTKDIKANLDYHYKELENYKGLVKEKTELISEIEASIKVSEESIAKLDVEIEARIEKIKEEELKVKEYMLNSQSTMRVNGYIEFIMGAQDFSDVVRRVEGMSHIRRRNEEIVQGLETEREALKEDQDLQVIQKANLVEDQELAVTQKAEAEELEKSVLSIISELHKEEAELQAQADNINSKIAADASKINKIGESTVSSLGFHNPVQGSYSITAGVWHYPPQYGGGRHNGTDFGVSRGTAIVSSGNGVVVGTQNGCVEGNRSCGGGYGNHVSSMISVNVDGVDKVYGVLYAHLQNGSLKVGSGSPITSGQLVALSGNTGSSTGPHLHVEVIYLGDDGINAAYDRWNGSPNFGTGSAYTDGRPCTSYGPPCRLDPKAVYGV